MVGMFVAFAMTLVVCEAATTTTSMPPASDVMPTTTMANVAPDVSNATIYYDFNHNTAMIVTPAGCYEYHMNHNDVLEAQDDATKPAIEARMLEELSRAINVQEMGHNHINHMTDEIVSACAAVPVYSWE